jgi:hypothetical protein
MGEPNENPGQDSNLVYRFFPLSSIPEHKAKQTQTCLVIDIIIIIMKCLAMV